MSWSVHLFVKPETSTLVKWIPALRPGESFNEYLAASFSREEDLTTHTFWLSFGYWQKGAELGMALRSLQWAPDSQTGTIRMEEAKDIRKDVGLAWGWRGPRTPGGDAQTNKQTNGPRLTHMSKIGGKVKHPRPSWLASLLYRYLIYGLAGGTQRGRHCYW